MVVCPGYYPKHKLLYGIVIWLFFVKKSDLQVALWKPKRKKKHMHIVHYIIPWHAYPWRPWPAGQTVHSLGLPWALQSLSWGGGGAQRSIDSSIDSSCNNSALRFQRSKWVPAATKGTSRCKYLSMNGGMDSQSSPVTSTKIGRHKATPLSYL